MPKRATHRLLFFAVIAVGLLAAAGCAPKQPRNLLFIVVDTLRADRLGCYGSGRDTSPAVDALAAEAVRFDRAYATAPWTRPSIASMLTGLYPSSHGARLVNQLLPRTVATLAEMLQAEGFTTAGVISHGVISRKAGFARGFDRFQESEARGHEHISTAGVTRQATEELEALAGEGQPFFLFVHYFDPHYRWNRYDEAGFAADRAGRLDGSQSIWEIREIRQDLSGEELGFIRDLYDEEIRRTDTGVGQLLDRLHDLGLDSETLVVFTADHGEEFMEHGWIGHTRALYEELVRVPLLIRPPSGSPAVIAQPVSLVSLAPTILELLCGPGLVGEYLLQGPSLAPLLRGESGIEDDPGVFIEVEFEQPESYAAEKTAYKKAVLEGPWKLIRDENDGSLELYDLEADPGEQQNLAGIRPKIRGRLLTRLEQRAGELEADAATPSLLDLDEKELEQLRGLGYIED
jgi:arylsulfatase A-like enzyme